MGGKAEPANHALAIALASVAVSLCLAAMVGCSPSGEAFVFLDDATIGFSAIPAEGKELGASAYSDFYRSEEMRDLFNRIVISAG